MLSPMGALAALLLVSASSAVSRPKTSADFLRAMEENQRGSLRAIKPEHKTEFYKKLASKAKPREMVPRRLNDEEDEFPFDVLDYSLKYTGCSSIEMFSDEVADDRDGDTVLATKRFVVFRLCPTENCDKSSTDGCSSGYGEYMIAVEEYLRAISEFNEERMEQICGYCAYCMQKVENQADANDRKLDENAYGDVEEEEEDGGGCANYDECKNDYYDSCVHYYQGQALDFDAFEECMQVDYGDDDGDNELFVGPYCADGYDITLGVYSDEYCSNYIGDQISVSQATGVDFGDEQISLNYNPKDCISCDASADNAAFWFGWEEYQDGNENNNNGYNNEYQEVEVLEMCREMYEMSAKCQSSIISDNGYGNYGGFATYLAQQQDELSCAYIGALQNGQYNENGEIVVDSAFHFPAFNFSDWKNGQQYIDEWSYAKQQASKVSPWRIFLLVVSIVGCFVLWVWACCLHAKLTNKNVGWRPRRGKNSDPNALSRQNSGIVLGRSRSGTTPLV